MRGSVEQEEHYGRLSLCHERMAGSDAIIQDARQQAESKVRSEEARLEHALDRVLRDERRARLKMLSARTEELDQLGAERAVEVSALLHPVQLPVPRSDCPTYSPFG